MAERSTISTACIVAAALAAGTLGKRRILHRTILASSVSACAIFVSGFTTNLDYGSFEEIPTLSILAGLSAPDRSFPLPEVVEVDGTTTPGDGGRRKMVYDSANACGAGGHPAADASGTTIGTTSTCVNSTVSGQSGSWNIDWSSVGDVANAALYGAKFQGSSTAAADTVAVQSAFNSGKAEIRIPVLGGTWNPTACVTVPVASPHIVFDGSYGTSALSIGVGPGLQTSQVPNCKGIITLTAGAAPWIVGLNANYTQPDPTQTALYTYPPLISAQNSGRFRLDHVLCSNATSCIDMRGNSGGAYIFDLKYNSYGPGIQIDGSIDTVRLEKLHWYPFNMTANQAVYYETPANGAIGVNSGRMDDLNISDSIFLGGIGLHTYTGTGTTYGGVAAGGGGTFGSITNTDFDTFEGIQMDSGSIVATASTFTLASALQSLVLNAGSFTCTSCNFGAQATGATSIYLPNGSTATATIGNSLFSSLTFDINDVYVLGGVMQLTGNQFFRTAGATYNKDTIFSNGGRLIATSNYAPDHGTGGGSGQFINILSDAQHSISNNVAPGWGYLTPSTGGGTGGVFAGTYQNY